MLNYKLIEVVGRKDAVGKPLLFGTTDEFLKRFNLNSIDDLPDKESLLDRIKTIRSDSRDQSLYRQFDISDEEIVPEKIQEQRDAEKNTQINSDMTNNINEAENQGVDANSDFV